MSSQTNLRKKTSEDSSSIFERLLQESKAKAENLRNEYLNTETMPSLKPQDPNVVRAIVSVKISDKIVRTPQKEIVLSTPFDDKLPDIEQENNSLVCKIHNREIGIFEEMPPDHCLNPNCEFYVKCIGTGPRPKLAAAPNSKRRKYCPLPLTTNTKESTANNAKQQGKSGANKIMKTVQENNANLEVITKNALNKSSDVNGTSANTAVEPAIEKQVKEPADEIVHTSRGTTRKRHKQTIFRKRFFLSSSDELASAIEKVNEDEEMVSFAVQSDDEDGADSIRTSTPITRINAIKRPHEIGLANKGNTCYVNATLQSLFILKDFMGHLKVLGDDKSDLHACLCVLDDLTTARAKGLPAQVDKFNVYFVRSLGMLHESYGERTQQDATEFLSRLLELIRNEFRGARNPVDVHFQFRLDEIFRCRRCLSKTARLQSNISVCLPIPDSATSLEDCLEAFLEEDERSMKCDRCGANKMNVSYRFNTIPNTLVISLKRYTNEGKISKEIDAPAVLDLKQFTKLEIANTKLKKVAEILHVGESLDEGHYISNVLCDDGLWRKYDDDSVSVVSHTSIRPNTYSYFYQKM